MWCVKNIWRVKQKISRNCAWFDFETMREGQKTKRAFDPTVTGNYTIVINNLGPINEKEFVYLAWW